MKILILYASKNGVTRECAETLCELLKKHDEVTLCSVKDGPLPSPADFDVAIVGSNIRMGLMNKEIKKYLKKHKTELSSMNTALFLCCGFADSFEEYCDVEIPKSLDASLGIHYFGGEMKPEKLRGIDKLVVKMVRSSIKTMNFKNGQLDQIPLPEILPENITRLADSIRELR